MISSREKDGLACSGRRNRAGILDNAGRPQADNPALDRPVVVSKTARSMELNGIVLGRCIDRSIDGIRESVVDRVGRYLESDADDILVVGDRIVRTAALEQKA